MNLKKIEQRYAKGYDFYKDSEVSQLFEDMEWLMDEATKAERYRKMIDEIEVGLADFGEITGDKRFVYAVRNLRQKLSL